MMRERRPERAVHKMVLKGPRRPGAEEWFCPSCGRHFLMEWPPRYGKVVIEPGDESVSHVGGKGGTDRPDGLLQDGPPVPSIEPWRQWLDDLGIEWDDPAA